MKPADRTRLLAALREHVAAIAADLRQKMRDPAFENGAARGRAKKLHEDEHVAEDFDVWTDLLSRRAAVLWVLKTVYVRVLEDRGLLSPGRLLDVESQHLFEKLAPNLGETAFLRWVFRDLASEEGGLPELFAPQPAEIVAPADELSRALLAFWRHRDADTGEGYRFADERFEGELMGDLYQELDPVVKDRFALCQTPDFVRTFILDRTLTPAIETFGIGTVRLLDPACGSGHFLIDGLRRLVAATVEARGGGEGAPTREEVVGCLERVVGIDLNDYACGLARARLIMTAAELLGLKSLAEAAAFHPHVYWADGLEQVERDEPVKPVQGELFGGEAVVEKVRATLTRGDVRAKLRGVLAGGFQAVVANPPYILERDEARKEYHRELIGKNRRYVSASGKYSLGSPFTERCFQLGADAAFVGLITSNNFMKREFGGPLIERVLSGVDMTLICDTSQAYIPFHGTPTVLLFARNRRPSGDQVRTVMGKRGESGTPGDPAKAMVWSSIVEGWATAGFENEFVSVAEVAREVLSRHPWSLGGGGAAGLKALLEERATSRLGETAEAIGITSVTGEDAAFVVDHELSRRCDVGVTRTLVVGDKIRDWSIAPCEQVVFPYDDTLQARLPERAELERRWLWPYRSILRKRKRFGTPMLERGLRWYELQELYPEKLRTPLTITFAFVATHNHFVLDRGGKVFKQSAPVIKLPPGSTEEDHLALLGLLNSSVACFWMKQVFHCKGSQGVNEGMKSALWEQFFEFDSTKAKLFPVADSVARTVPLASALDDLARSRSTDSVSSVLAEDTWSSPASLRATLSRWRERDHGHLMRMVALQEELDWLAYALYGIDPSPDHVPPEKVEPLAPNALPWCLTLAARDAENRAAGDVATEGPTAWFDRHRWPPLAEAPATLSAATRKRIASRLERARNTPALALIESANFKRRWYNPDYADQEQKALEAWLADRVEAAAQGRATAFTLDHLVATLQDDPRVLAVCEVLTDRPDFNLGALLQARLTADAVPNHRFHVYKAPGLVKREAWERTWADQRREDAGEKVTPDVPPAYGTPDFLKTEYWQLRGKLDVPKERFIAFTEVPGRTGAEVLYGWAGWTPLQRLRGLLAIDEDLEDAGAALADRVGVLDSAWRLLPDVARDDAKAAASLKAELSALVGPEGPSAQMVADWAARFPAKLPRATKEKPPAVAGDDIPTDDATEASLVAPKLDPAEDAMVFIYALLHAAGGTATRTDLARAFALRASPSLLKRLAPRPLKQEVARWRSSVGTRKVKAGTLANTLRELSARGGVSVGVDSESRSTVTTSAYTLSSGDIDPWFHFEADLALRVLRAQPAEDLGVIDGSLSAADRKLVEQAA